MFTLAQGNFQLPGGGPVASGVLTLTLSNPSATVVATGAAAPTSYTITLDANGNLPAGTTVLGNSELTPAGTFYTASLVTSGGTTVTLTNNVWVVGPSAPYAGTLFPDVSVYPAISLSFQDGFGVPHVFISSSSPYPNTFVQGNGSGGVFLGSAAKTSVADTTGNIVTAGSLGLQTTSGTLTASIANDTAGGILFTTNAGKGWQISNSTGQLQGFTGVTILLQGGSSGSTVLQPSAVASGTLTLPAATDTLVGKATTDLLTNKTFDTAGAGNVFKIGGTQITSGVLRSTLDATAKNWQFLGSATGSGVTVGPVIWSGTFTQFMIMYTIKGYSGGTPVGRLLFGPGTPSTTALTNGSNLSESVTAPTSAPSIPGCPLAVTLSNIGRAGVCFVNGASGSLKTYFIEGQNGSPSVSAPPQLFRATGAFSDLSTNLPLQQAQLTVYDTLTATAASTNSFVAGTNLVVWGRNAD